MRVVFTKSALAELDEIFFYIEKVNPAAAARVATRIEQLAFQLGQFPKMGRPKYKPGVLARFHRIVCPGSMRDGASSRTILFGEIGKNSARTSAALR